VTSSFLLSKLTLSYGTNSRVAGVYSTEKSAEVPLVIGCSENAGEMPNVSMEYVIIYSQCYSKSIYGPCKFLASTETKLQFDYSWRVVNS
jgi:hypothetical protein